MTLTEQVSADLKAAMKSGDRRKLETLRMLRAQLVDLDKRGTGKEVTPDDELGALMGAIKQRREAVELYDKGGRADLAENEKQEIAILNAYLPAPMSADEASDRIGRIIAETGASSVKDLGKVMGVAMKELKGRIDGKIVQDLVRKKLGG